MDRHLASRIVAAFTAAALAVALASCGRLASHSDIEREFLALATLDEREIPAYLEDFDRVDSVGAFYKDRSTRGKTLTFFTSLVHSGERGARHPRERGALRGAGPRSPSPWPTRRAGSRYPR